MTDHPRKPLLFSRPSNWDEMTEAERQEWATEVAREMGIPEAEPWVIEAAVDVGAPDDSGNSP